MHWMDHVHRLANRIGGKANAGGKDHVDGRGDEFFIIVSTELNGPFGTRTEVITILES